MRYTIHFYDSFNPDEAGDLGVLCDDRASAVREVERSYAELKAEGLDAMGPLVWRGDIAEVRWGLTQNGVTRWFVARYTLLREVPADAEAVSVVTLQFLTSQAARFALGNGVPRDTVVAILRDLSAAIADPGSVAEDMSPILPDEF